MTDAFFLQGLSILILLIITGIVVYLIALAYTEKKPLKIVLSYLISALGFLLLLSYMSIETLKGNKPIEEMSTHLTESFFLALSVPILFAVGMLLRKNFIIQEELNSTARRLKILLNNLPEIIFTLDEEGRFKTINDTFERKLKLERKSWINRPIEELLQEENQIKIKKLLESARKGQGTAGIIKISSLTGRTFYFSVRLYFLKEFNEFIGIATDVTELRLLEEKLEQYAKKLEESNHLLRLFIDIVSHDIINPLTLARGYVEIAYGDNKREEYEKILKYLDRSIEIAESVKKFSKISEKEEIEMEDIDLVKLIKKTIMEVEQCYMNKNIEVRTKMPESLKIKGNKLLGEVFFNILHNACKYSPENSYVEVGIQDLGDRVLIYFADQGEGIPDEHKESIFKRFHRLKKGGVKGTGIGLAIVKKVVELHKGRVWVEDNKPRGSIFKVELPKNTKT